MCFTVGSATAQNIYTLMICRFMQGAWGVAPLTVVPGMVVDMWDGMVRVIALMAWAATIFVGPTVSGRAAMTKVRH
jgi:MFS transporter, DHA1 family, multidrug resistance protein